MKKRIIGISLLIIIACLFIGFFVYPNFFKSDEPEIEILFVGDTSEDLNELYREKPGALMLNVIYGYCLSVDLWGAAEEKKYSERIKKLMLYGLLKNKNVTDVLALKDGLSLEEERIKIRDRLNWAPAEEVLLATLLIDPLWNHVNATDFSEEQLQYVQNNINVFLESFIASKYQPDNLKEIDRDIYSDDEYAEIVCNVVDFINISVTEGGELFLETIDYALPYAAAIYFKKSLSIGSNTCTNRQFEAIMHRRVLSMDKDELKTVLRRGRYDIFFHESKKGVIPASLDELTELWYHQIHTKQTILP